MSKKYKGTSTSGIIVLFLVLINAITLKSGYTGDRNWYMLLFVTVPLLLLAVFNFRQKKHAILRNFPAIGYLRYFFESIRPEIRRYFFESDFDRKPFNRR